MEKDRPPPETIGPAGLGEMSAFATVVDAKGFAAAARRLGLSKASVSRLVQRLEDRLGVRLLNRTTRRLSLTEAGRTFYDGAHRMLSEAASAEAAVTQLAARPTGTLRLSVPMSFGSRHLGPILADFLALCPELGLDMVLGDRLIDLVEEGFDAALRIGALGGSNVVARRLCRIRRVVCASPSYLAEHGTPTKPVELGEHDCLHYTYYSGGRSWRFRDAAGREAAVEVGGRVEMNNGDALAALAIAGQGLCHLPTFIVAAALREGRLVALLPGWDDAEPAHLHVIYQERRNLAPKVRAFVDFLAERLTDPAPWDAGLALQDVATSPRV
jgi:DNA-binding transcriptional LysR family regulator